MATYQFTVYQFGSINFAPGSESDLETNNTTQGFQAVGETFTYNGDLPIRLTIQDDDPDANDGNADPIGGTPSGSNGNQIVLTDSSSAVGWEGQGIQLEYRITVLVNGGPQTRDFFVVRIGPNTGGTNVGIVGETAPVPGESYTIISATDQETPTLQRTYSAEANTPFVDTPGTNAVPWDALACFTHGTLIDTPDGLRLIEDLMPGDLVTTLDNGSKPLRWVGTRPVQRHEMLAIPALQPILFETGAIGNTRPLLVSQQHRMFLNDWRAQVFFGEDEVLIAAKALANGKTVRPVVPDDGVTYCHLLFDRHEVILAEGALSESFHPGDIALAALDEDQRRELQLMFPTLVNRPAAFPIVRNAEARGLMLAG